MKLFYFILSNIFLFCNGFQSLIKNDPKSLNVTVGELRENYHGSVGDGIPPNIYLFHLPKDQLGMVETEIPASTWNATDKGALLISAWTNESTLSFMMPMTIEKFKFYQARRFLCPSDKKKQTDVYVAISSESDEKVDYRLQLRPVEKGNFIIEKLDRKITDFSIGPAWPDGFQFIFPEGVDIVDIVVTAVADDRIVDQTAFMFIQEAKCPMLALADDGDKALRTVQFTRHATITLKKTSLTSSVYLNFVATKNQTKPTHKKKIHLVITKSGSDMAYSMPIGGAIGISVFIFLIPALCMLALKLTGRRGSDERPTRSVPIGEGGMAQPAVYEENVIQGDVASSRDRLAADPEDADHVSVYPSSTPTMNRYARLHWINLANSYHVIGGISAVAVLLLFAIMLPLWSEYEKNDKCYFNYECLRYQYSFPAFNHVFSAAFAYGSCALAITFYIILAHCCFPGGQGNGKSKQIRPIIMSAVLCILAQGFISSLYQSCPTRFLHFTENSFLLLALFLGMASFYYSMQLYGLVGFWILITVLAALSESDHFGTAGRLIAMICTILFVLGLGFIHVQNTKYVEEKSYRQIAYSPLIYLAVLWVIIQAATVAVFGQNIMDYTTYITFSVVIASCLYMGFHIAKKRENETSGHYLTVLSLALTGLAFWIIGLTYYAQKRVDVMTPPAISRTHNTQCTLWTFYDSNDIWAFCSAYAIFYQFMSLLFYKAI